METNEKTQKQTLSYTGTIVEFGDAVQGETWLKQDFTIRTNEEYPQLINFLTFNNAQDQLSRCKVEDEVVVYFNAKSRKFQTKWYTELTAWKIVINFKKKSNE
jgi:hypothetical protein